MSYLESVQELRVDMANNTAEFGAIGQLTIISKAGGNKLTGSLFDYYSTTAFYAATHSLWCVPLRLFTSQVARSAARCIFPGCTTGRTKPSSLLLTKLDAAAPCEHVEKHIRSRSWRSGDFFIAYDDSSRPDYGPAFFRQSHP